MIFGHDNIFACHLHCGDLGNAGSGKNMLIGSKSVNLLQLSMANGQKM